jgi:hypothetical protein
MKNIPISLPESEFTIEELIKQNKNKDELEIRSALNECVKKGDVVIIGQRPNSSNPKGIGRPQLLFRKVNQSTTQNKVLTKTVCKTNDKWSIINIIYLLVFLMILGGAGIAFYFYWAEIIVCSILGFLLIAFFYGAAHPTHPCIHCIEGNAELVKRNGKLDLYKCPLCGGHTLVKSWL